MKINSRSQFLLILFFILSNTGTSLAIDSNKGILTGAEQTEKYLPILKNKKIALVANQTSIIGDIHLVDTLTSLGIQIQKVFGPEHGFRGKASAGMAVQDEKDTKTGIDIISLYGSKSKPSAKDLEGIDLLIFDIQDVGCRFYTYINVLRDVMEACGEHQVEMLILDRPNPNAYLVDGPVLNMDLKSGIGQFPIPIAHGLTIGEFALMIKGEKWMSNPNDCQLNIIPLANYRHSMPYTLPVSPSPNLNTQQSIMLYPSTCLFEGTYLNHGRGTYHPFTIIGSPDLKDHYSFSFTPEGIEGMSEEPLFKNQICYGIDLRDFDLEVLRKKGRLNLDWIIEMYEAFPDKEKFFDRSLSPQMNDIDILSGDYEFRKQIENSRSVEEIQASWEPELSEYKSMRQKYLLYD